MIHARLLTTQITEGSWQHLHPFTFSVSPRPYWAHVTHVQRLARVSVTSNLTVPCSFLTDLSHIHLHLMHTSLTAHYQSTNFWYFKTRILIFVVRKTVDHDDIPPSSESINRCWPRCGQIEAKVCSSTFMPLITPFEPCQISKFHFLATWITRVGHLRRQLELPHSHN